MGNERLSPGERARQIVAQILGAAPAFAAVTEKRIVVKLGGSALKYQRQLLQDYLWLRALGAS